MATASYQPKLPQLNLHDLPELMPGAQPSANPAARSEFEERCRSLYETEENEQHSDSEPGYPVSASWIDGLAAMFPTIDLALVRSIAADSRTQNHAIDTLLAISASNVAEPNPPSEAKIGVSLGDAQAFPVLVGTDGWQVVSQQLLEQDNKEELGSAWCDRVKSVADKPAPQTVVAQVPKVAKVKKRTHKKETDSFDGLSEETEYEIRQRGAAARLQSNQVWPSEANRG